MSKKSKTPSNVIATNKRAHHDYYLEQRFEAGLALEGWEVKSIRAGQVQLRDSYVLLKNGEAFLIGVHISPLKTASTHIDPKPDRDRKLLLHEKELGRLRVAKEREGNTIVPVNLHWTRNRVKAEIAIAKGKKQHDKRATQKDRDWGREKQRLLKK